jgi:hypothetical protein
MSSPFSSELAKLDGSLQSIQYQLDSLRAALEVNDDQLSTSVTEARQHATILRNLIRTERPDANWADRESLNQLIRELEIERRNRQCRAKLLELASELDAGSVKHRLNARCTALNTLRLEAVKELQSQAALAKEVKDLPGPSAGEWIHWACTLQDNRDATILMNLRRDFGTLERFASEMEESYWIPGQPVRDGSNQPSEASIGSPEAGAETLGGTSAKPMAAVLTYQDGLPENVRAEFEKASRSGDYSQALSLCYEHQSSAAPSVAETVSSQDATPLTNYCEKCGRSYRKVHVCLLDDPALQGASDVPPVDKDNLSPPLQRFIEGLDRGMELSSEPTPGQPAEQPSIDISDQPATRFVYETLEIRGNGELSWIFINTGDADVKNVTITFSVKYLSIPNGAPIANSTAHFFHKFREIAPTSHPEEGTASFANAIFQVPSREWQRFRDTDLAVAINGTLKYENGSEKPIEQQICYYGLAWEWWLPSARKMQLKPTLYRVDDGTTFENALNSALKDKFIQLEATGQPRK